MYSSKSKSDVFPQNMRTWEFKRTLRKRDKKKTIMRDRARAHKANFQEELLVKDISDYKNNLENKKLINTEQLLPKPKNIQKSKHLKKYKQSLNKTLEK